jgi:hypothetical protein
MQNAISMQTITSSRSKFGAWGCAIWFKRPKKKPLHRRGKVSSGFPPGALLENVIPMQRLNFGSWREMRPQIARSMMHDSLAKSLEFFER